jgi:hypothetical protein
VDPVFILTARAANESTRQELRHIADQLPADVSAGFHDDHELEIAVHGRRRPEATALLQRALIAAVGDDWSKRFDLRA